MVEANVNNRQNRQNILSISSYLPRYDHNSKLSDRMITGFLIAAVNLTLLRPRAEQGCRRPSEDDEDDKSSWTIRSCRILSFDSFVAQLVV